MTWTNTKRVFMNTNLNVFSFLLFLPQYDGGIMFFRMERTMTWIEVCLYLS
jgi:hypothetical protein